MKKTIAWFLALAMAAGLTACGGYLRYLLNCYNGAHKFRQAV